MKIITLVFAFCQSAYFVHAQDNFIYSRDFNTILELSRDSVSEIYFPDMYDRFYDNDSTLTNWDMLALMIGYTGSYLYQPYKFLSEQREILKLVRNEQYNEAIVKCDTILSHDPLNYTALLEKGFSLWKLDDPDFGYYKSQYFKILDAILFSGDGSKENAYFILGPMDGQVIIPYVWKGTIGRMGSARDAHGNFLDMLEMIDENQESTEIYFNIQHAIKFQ